MNISPIVDFSDRLKEIAKDLSFLAQPRYPLKELSRLFPQHQDFILELEDVSVAFGVDVKAKRLAMDKISRDLENAELSLEMKFIFYRRIEDYRTLLSMMETFYSTAFFEHCKKLYGSSLELVQHSSFQSFLDKIPDFCVPDVDSKKLKGESAFNYLREKLNETFHPTQIEVKASSSLLSDSSAGRKVLKLNPHKEYSTQQLDIFLVHEGWAHLGTSLNGAMQINHPWLGTWAPGSTPLQEGLAILSEIVTGVMTKERWSKVQLRHFATCMAENGTPIQDVYGFLRHHEIDALDAFKLSLRVFRGVPLEGGMAFTKESLYLHGLIRLLAQLNNSQTDLKTFWLGKMSFEEHEKILRMWGELNPSLTFYPSGLNHPEVQKRLGKLQTLEASLFSHGY